MGKRVRYQPVCRSEPSGGEGSQVAEQSDAEVLDAHTLQWSTELIEQLLEANELALRIQASLPPDVRETLDDLPSGYRGSAAAAAVRVNPTALREANVWLAGTRDYLRSLSHPTPTMDAKRGDEIGAEGVQDDMADRLEALEQRAERIERLLTRLTGGDAEAPQDAARSARTDPPAT